MAGAIDVGEECFFTCGGCPCEHENLYDCADIWGDMPKCLQKGERKTGRAYRRRMKAQKFTRQKGVVLRRSSRAMRLGVDRSILPAASTWSFWKFAIDDRSVRGTYIKRTKSSKYKKACKDYSNRVVRGNADQLQKGNQYRRLFNARHW